ncbi:MAG: hypothetical protein QOJ64_3432 [Acidobacteriota bacterium]|jgi:hypothetical protein|nr:hypothetical protein [Acidobacteriota bacterium]
MSYDDDSPRISPAAIAIVLIAVIIGALWWMNKYGAGGPSQADTTPSPPAGRPLITPQRLTNEQLGSQFKQDRMNRAVENGQVPLVTVDQARRAR